MKYLSKLIFIAALFFPGICTAIGNENILYEPLVLRDDDAESRVAPKLAPGSHVKVSIPSLPYIYTSHAISSGLIRPANNKKGWEYDVAVSHRQIDDTTYEFNLREGVLFQDGSVFDADSVVMNMEYFKKQPFLFTNIHNVFDYVEKVDQHTVRFHLKEKYGQFFNDTMWIHFYTPDYLNKYGWNGKATCPNLAAPGPYGLGPYILTEGYVEGDRSTDEVKLKANPYYWDKRYPKVENVTIYPKMSAADAMHAVKNIEGKLDIATIPFSSKVETIVSPYAKVVKSPSNNNFSIQLNLINGNPKLQDKKVRVALNRAIHQKNLLDFVYDGEGSTHPTTAAVNFPGVRDVVKTLRPYSELEDPNDPEVQKELKAILNGLTLKFYAQDRFKWLIDGIEYQLKKVGVTLDVEYTSSETDVFGQLLTTNAGNNSKKWDLLIWGMDDWYFNHPWTVFLVYRTYNLWSTISPDSTLDGYVEKLFTLSVGTEEFVSTTEKIMRHIYDNGYMLFVPGPNKVLATNKEVVYTPYKVASIPLWEIEVTNDHWSLRDGPYPEELKKPIKIIEKNFQDLIQLTEK
ncbi:MAG: ABC transporter substrate-binding protein [Gammaproteobacteria bacterium]